MDEKDNEARDAEDVLGLRRGAPASGRARGAFVLEICDLSVGEVIGPNAWNSQGVTSSLFLVFGVEPEELDGRSFICGCAGGDS